MDEDAGVSGETREGESGAVIDGEDFTNGAWVLKSL